MSLPYTLRLSRRTCLRQLGAASVLVALGPAGAWATREMVQQAVRERIGTRAALSRRAIARRRGFGYNVLRTAWGLTEGRTSTRENGQGIGGTHLLWI